MEPRAANAYIQRHKLWAQKESVGVHFLNPDILEEWRCGGDTLSTVTIMAWAGGAWNSPFYANVPKFEMAENKRRADIRVLFTGKHKGYLCSAVKIIGMAN